MTRRDKSEQSGVGPPRSADVLSRIARRRSIAREAGLLRGIKKCRRKSLALGMQSVREADYLLIEWREGGKGEKLRRASRNAELLSSCRAIVAIYSFLLYPARADGRDVRARERARRRCSERALGGDGESRGVTFDPHQCAAAAPVVVVVAFAWCIQRFSARRQDSRCNTDD